MAGCVREKMKDQKCMWCKNVSIAEKSQSEGICVCVENEIA